MDGLNFHEELQRYMDIYQKKMREEHERQGNHMTDIQRRIQGQVEQVNVNIIPRDLGSRAGDDDRKRAIHHIKEMEAKGYLPEKEATARIEYAATAEKHNDLLVLTSDLPAPVDPRGFWRKWNWDEGKYFIPALLAGMFASICAGVIPGVILGRLNEFNTAMGLAVFIPLLALGVIGFFTSLSILVVKMS